MALLAATAMLYAWGIDASGYANQYYAAAVQAGTRSWAAMLFGSLDAGNAITVDKPPASLWVMAASGRIFGFSSWSLLLPQAAEGVAAVGLLYAAVRRWSGHRAGLLAGTKRLHRIAGQVLEMIEDMNRIAQLAFPNGRGRS